MLMLASMIPLLIFLVSLLLQYSMFLLASLLLQESLLSRNSVPGASYYCLHSLLLLAFLADDSVLASEVVPNYASAHDAAGISASACAPPVTGISAFAGGPLMVGFLAVP